MQSSIGYWAKCLIRFWWMDLSLIRAALTQEVAQNLIDSMPLRLVSTIISCK